MKKTNNNRRYRMTAFVAEKLGIEVNTSGRYRLNKEQEDKYLEITETKTNQYKNDKKKNTNLGFNAISIDGGIMDIDTYCDFYKLDRLNVRSYKLVTHTAIPYYNIAFYESEEERLVNIDFTSIFKDKIEPVYYDFEVFNSNGFDKLILSDIHIGMDVDKDGFSLYDGIWNEEELNNRLELVINWVCQHQKFDTLYISDLGDLMDGWDGMTIRREHHLPQNMDNQKAFDVAFRFKIRLIGSLIGSYNKIIFNNITDDNHSGAFAYIVNSAVKSYLELKYPNNVEVNIQRKFIDHYTVMDKFIFIECHGKDGGNMKFGFKPQLDDKQIKIISNYIDENYLSKKGVIIEFNKGDSHQSLIDKSSSKKFQYHNFPSFAPPSNWVKTNFSNSMSGFSFRNYYLNGQMSNHDYIF